MQHQHHEQQQQQQQQRSRYTLFSRRQRPFVVGGDLLSSPVAVGCPAGSAVDRFEYENSIDAAAGRRGRDLTDSLPVVRRTSLF